jgi:hypothetical protein
MLFCPTAYLFMRNRSRETLLMLFVGLVAKRLTVLAMYFQDYNTEPKRVSMAFQ